MLSEYIRLNYIPDIQEVQCMQANTGWYIDYLLKLCADFALDVKSSTIVNMANSVL